MREMVHYISYPKDSPALGIFKDSALDLSDIKKSRRLIVPVTL